MDKYFVKVLPRAYRDIDEIYTYISRILLENEIAMNFVKDIEKVILDLEGFPYRGAERKIGAYANKGYRQIFYKNFSIIYRIDESQKTVIILTVRYSKRNFWNKKYTSYFLVISIFFC